MRVLLSIKPHHVGNILSGKKTFEFRRKIFARRDVRTVLIYSTLPVGRFVAEFDIDCILVDKPSILWGLTEDGSGITKSFFDAYFKGCERAYALKIGALRTFEPPIIPVAVIDDFVPPQSYMYVSGSGQDIRRYQQLVLV